MKEINQSFRIVVDENMYNKEYERADKRKLGSVFKHHVVFLIERTAIRVEKLFLQ